MNRVESRIKKIEETLSPTPGKPIRIILQISHIGKGEMERLEYVYRKGKQELISHSSEEGDAGRKTH